MLRILLVVGLILAVGACVREDESPEPDPTSAPTPATRYQHYVALGDSYTAGPGIAEGVPESGTCFRSTNNYPALLAQQLRIDDLTDVSCSGATTASASTGKNGGVNGQATPPQLDALDADTDLVTIGLGGNDGGYSLALFGQCFGERAATTCPAFVDQQLPGLLSTIRTNLGAFVDAVRQRAPAARVVLVGYLRITPDSGTCPAAGTSAEVVAQARSSEERLESTLATVAKEKQVTLLPVSELTADHGVCSKDPWVNGRVAVPNDGVVAHPRRAGMQAVADELARVLS